MCCVITGNGYLIQIVHELALQNKLYPTKTKLRNHVGSCLSKLAHYKV